MLMDKNYRRSTSLSGNVRATTLNAQPSRERAMNNLRVFFQIPEGAQR